MRPAAQGDLLDLAAPAERAGFRLHRLELYNWGTFHEKVWALAPGGDNVLVTGDIGSGKSTLVDALTTLLVPPQKLAYNKAAGAEARERTLRSYVLGYYKSERGEAGTRPVALRDHNAYSVILGRFFNEGFGQDVTLAQVFWITDGGQPERFYVVADAGLSIQSDFAGFGPDIRELRKRLKARPHVQVDESFAAYATAFRRRFGIENEQALDLFHQTVSMKSVGDLTEFVREHMLEPFPVEPCVDKLLRHYDDLNRAHEAVLRAKDQVSRLDPIVADCDRHAAVDEDVKGLRACREALHPWFAAQKAELLDRRLANLDDELRHLDDRLAEADRTRAALDARRDELKMAIAANGGDRIERLKLDIRRAEDDRDERKRRADRYDALAAALGLPPAADDAAYTDNRAALDAERERADAALAEVQNRLREADFELRGLLDQQRELEAELASLRQRRSNVPARMLRLRETLCRAVGLAEDALPFAGELLQVREDARDWEGAIERLLHGFGQSLLVPDACYARVNEWVDRTHTGERLVYYRVRPGRQPERGGGSDALWRKLDLKPDAAFDDWLEAELSRRFDHVCCDTLDRFRREHKAVTRAGQVKGGEERHEKDDRHRLDDRTRYVLGWSNDGKIAALAGKLDDVQARGARVTDRRSKLDAERRAHEERLRKIDQLAVFTDFRDLEWRPLVVGVEAMRRQLEELLRSSDKLRTLADELRGVEADLRKADEAIQRLNSEHGTTAEKRSQAHQARRACDEVLAAAPSAHALFPRVEALRAESGQGRLTVESCDNRQTELRVWLQARIDAEDKNLSRLQQKIVAAMQAYRGAYPLETREADASVEAAAEYRRMLDALRADDLPRFESRFKALLNENAIVEVAGFQSKLRIWEADIRERIATINGSLRAIDYNPGRYIALVADPNLDVEIREFRQDLRACTEGALTGSDDDGYSEAKFLQVKRIIERFRGRENSAEADRRWTRKVTDVRRWFSFSASERWREDDREHEHYSDSGGKSGGQKEKLAYTVLAASLACQFGLEWSDRRSRSFRFVAIDEAFGRGSDESARYALELFSRLRLQLLIVTPLQKIHVIEPYVAAVGFAHNHEGRLSMLRNLTVEEYRAERDARG